MNDSTETLARCQRNVCALYRRRVREACARGDLSSAKFWRVKAGEWAAKARNVAAAATLGAALTLQGCAVARAPDPADLEALAGLSADELRQELRKPGPECTDRRDAFATATPECRKLFNAWLKRQDARRAVLRGEHPQAANQSLPTDIEPLTTDQQGPPVPITATAQTDDCGRSCRFWGFMDRNPWVWAAGIVLVVGTIAALDKDDGCPRGTRPVSVSVPTCDADGCDGPTITRTECH